MTSPEVSEVSTCIKAFLMRLFAYAPLFVLAGSVVSIGGALFFQYGVGLHPCELCIWQRWPYLVIAPAGALAWVYHARPKLRAMFLVIAGLALLGTAGIAIFHSGVERHIWQSNCTAAIDFSSPAAQLASIMQAPTTRCDEIPWSLFGLSMANYHILLAGGLGVFSLMAAASGSCRCCCCRKKGL